MESVVYFYTDEDNFHGYHGNRLAINLNKVSSIRMTRDKTLLIDMDNGFIHIVEGIEDRRIYDDLIHAFENEYIGENDDLLHNGIKVSKIYVTGLETE